MTSPVESRPRLLALSPGSRGMGYMVLEGDSQLVDWGVRKVVGKEVEMRAVLYALLDRYRPHVMVCERNVGSTTRKGERARFIIHIADSIARERHIVFRQYSIRQVENIFAQWQAVSKAQRATILAERFPVLAAYLPPPRRPWKGEDRRMAIFDALSIALTHVVISARVEETLKTIPF